MTGSSEEVVRSILGIGDHDSDVVPELERLVAGPGREVIGQRGELGEDLREERIGLAMDFLLVAEVVQAGLHGIEALPQLRVVGKLSHTLKRLAADDFWFALFLRIAVRGRRPREGPLLAPSPSAFLNGLLQWLLVHRA